MDNKISVEEILEQNERRIHYQIKKMNIRDPHKEYFQEGLVALWNAYETYQPDKGPMATYFNYTIRNRLIDRMRKENKHTEMQRKAIHEQLIQASDGNHHSEQSKATIPLVHTYNFPINDPDFWKQIKTHLTENQWKWVYYHIIEDMPYKDIAITENTTVDAVKSWGKQVKKKLKSPQFRKTIHLEISSTK
ncbi:sigma-70 family RNA polymerase sigma factor [Virgibacillus doumboii]|uniref:sigma-70 family RNA polymerase sigma factor n=1 Tax=Virgibacillus doumboii TaxID=2697503 RepID=UPI0013DF5D9F|nr:sigma-70 family RNA polymerase sigma factor [Virgibacillus doumboii]